MPGITSESLENFAFAGDWIDRGGHRSWSQEKALVTGLQAARATVEGLAALGAADLADVPAPLDVEEDEPHVALGRSALKAVRGALPF